MSAEAEKLREALANRAYTENDPKEIAAAICYSLGITRELLEGIRYEVEEDLDTGWEALLALLEVAGR